jgi:cell volume regulation protein A
LRGAVPIILALLPLLAGVYNAWLYFNVAFFVVLASLLVQGWTVAPVARWLGLQVPASAGAIQRVNLEVPGQYDQEFVGYRVTPASAAAGEAPKHLNLPVGVRMLTILRNETSLDPASVKNFEPGDYVYLLAPGAEVPELDALFAERMKRAELEAHRFFGDFALNGSARLGDVAAIYGFDIESAVADRTLEQFLLDMFRARPVVGDRWKLGNTELIVREMDGNQITKVGLRLASDTY